MGHMVNVRRALIAVLLLALAAFAWLWLTRPRRVDMTAYAPADSIVYAEADSLPAAAEESDTTLKFTPRAALVAETHSPGWRVRAAVEKIVGDFARGAFERHSFE